MRTIRGESKANGQGGFLAYNRHGQIDKPFDEQSYNIDDVINHLVENFDGEEVTVYQGPRIVAVVGMGPDGKPVATKF